MRRHSIAFGVWMAWIALLASCGPATATGTVAPTPEPTKGEVVQIRWFVGLGTGADPAQLKAEQAAVDAFNQSVGKDKNIQLILDVNSSATAKDTLSARIAADNSPDIVGPISWADANAFDDQWQDITTYLEMTGFDTSVFASVVSDVYKSDNETLSLPFAVYPSVVFYNVEIFNRAGLAYPPDRYGEQYIMPDGSEVDWTWDTMAALARLLTFDGAGANATDLAFDKSTIRQYGFSWFGANHPNFWGSYWGGGSMLGSDKKSAKAPEEWKAAWNWTYDAMWSDQPFIASKSAESGLRISEGSLLAGNNVAMTVLPFRYACCMGSAGTWDIGVLPSYNGKITGRMEESTFRILKGSKHPQEAFTVLQYLVTTAVDTLIIGSQQTPAAFPAVPALISAKAKWVTAKAEEFSSVQSLDVVLENMKHPDVPNVEGYVPHYDEAWTRGNSFTELLRTTPGLDLEVAIAAYMADLTALFSK